MTMNFITYNSSNLTYTIHPGAATADIKSLLNSAVKNTTFFFTEGTHNFTDKLHIRTDGTRFTGAGQDKTTFLFDPADGAGHGIHVGNSGYKDDWLGVVTKTVKAGSHTLQLQDASALRAGDLILVRQKNSRDWLDDNGYDTVPDSYIFKTPINESLVEIQSINGNILTLKQPITHDMNALDTTDMTTTVRLIDATYNVTLADFNIRYALGESKPDSMTNTQPEFLGTAALQLGQTVDAKISHVSVDEAPSHGLEFHTSLRPSVDHFSADGAHNKGSTGDGYGVHISETHYGSFKNLELTDMRHALVFSSWHTEVGNEVNILSANRDINYHGGPDYNNVVVVEREIYRSGSFVWPIVSPGDYHHPKTDIDANTTVFGIAQATGLSDKFHGWDQGAWLDGAAGDDIIYGGIGNDVLIGGKGVDVIRLGSGNDIVAFRPGHGTDDVFGFGAGDRILLDGFSGVSSFGQVNFTNLSSGVQVKIVGEILALLHGVKAENMAADDFLFNQAHYFTPPGEAVPPPPEPLPASGIEVNATTGSDNIAGTGHDDIVHGWLSQLNGTDRITLGAGTDTLHIRNGTVSFDSNAYPLLSGIDRLDLSDTGNANLVIGNAFVASSDDETLTILYNRGLKFLDTSGVSDQHSVLLKGHGVVNLSDRNDAVTIANGSTGRFYGKAGNDSLYGSDGADFLYGGSGNDILSGGKGSDRLNGGGGTDIFRYGDILEGGDMISDFSAADVLDLEALFAKNDLSGKSAAEAQTDGNLVLQQSGAHTIVSFDADGAGTGSSARVLVTLENRVMEDLDILNFAVV